MKKKTKKILLTATAICSLFGTGFTPLSQAIYPNMAVVKAEEAEAEIIDSGVLNGSITYELYNDGVLHIKNSGDSVWDNIKLANILGEENAKSVKKIVLESSIKAKDLSYAFADLVNLEEINSGYFYTFTKKEEDVLLKGRSGHPSASGTKIDYAFSGCENLKKIDLKGICIYLGVFSSGTTGNTIYKDEPRGTFNRCDSLYEIKYRSDADIYSNNENPLILGEPLTSTNKKSILPNHTKQYYKWYHSGARTNNTVWKYDVEKVALAYNKLAIAPYNDSVTKFYQYPTFSGKCYPYERESGNVDLSTFEIPQKEYEWTSETDNAVSKGTKFYYIGTVKYSDFCNFKASISDNTLFENISKESWEILKNNTITEFDTAYRSSYGGCSNGTGLKVWAEIDAIYVPEDITKTYFPEALVSTPHLDPEEPIISPAFSIDIIYHDGSETTTKTYSFEGNDEEYDVLENTNPLFVHWEDKDGNIIDKITTENMFRISDLYAVYNEIIPEKPTPENPSIPDNKYTEENKELTDLLERMFFGLTEEDTKTVDLNEDITIPKYTVIVSLPGASANDIDGLNKSLLSGGLTYKLDAEGMAAFVLPNDTLVSFNVKDGGKSLSEIQSAVTKSKEPIKEDTPKTETPTNTIDNTNKTDAKTDAKTDNKVTATNPSNTEISTYKIASLKVSAKGKKIKVTWKKNTNVKKYQIQIAKNKKMKKNLKTYTTSKAKYNTKKLKKGTYYVRVRGVNDKTTCPWTKVVKVKIK